MKTWAGAAGLLAVVLTVWAAALSGCGSALAGSGANRTAGTLTARGVRTDAPGLDPGGSAAEGRALGRELLAGLDLPSGTVAAGSAVVRSLPEGLRNPWVRPEAESVSLAEIVVAPAKPAVVDGLLTAHPPRGAGRADSGTTNAADGKPVQWLVM